MLFPCVGFLVHLCITLGTMNDEYSSYVSFTAIGTCSALASPPIPPPPIFCIFHCPVIWSFLVNVAPPSPPPNKTRSPTTGQKTIENYTRHDVYVLQGRTHIAFLMCMSVLFLFVFHHLVLLFFFPVHFCLALPYCLFPVRVVAFTPRWSTEALLTTHYRKDEEKRREGCTLANTVTV